MIVDSCTLTYTLRERMHLLDSKIPSLYSSLSLSPLCPLVGYVPLHVYGMQYTLLESELYCIECGLT